MKSCARSAMFLAFCLVCALSAPGQEKASKKDKKPDQPPAPDGAEIAIDGKFVGTTPSTVHLTPGEHTVTIDKSSFKPWQRTITITAGGTVNLEAALEKLP